MKPFTRFLMIFPAVLLVAGLLGGCAKEEAASSSAASTEPTASTTTTTTQPAPVIPSVGWCNADSLYVREQASPSAKVIGGMKFGEKVEILDKEGDWYKISFKVTVEGVQYETAYVSAQYIQDTEPIPSVASTSASASTAATTAA